MYTIKDYEKDGKKLLTIIKKQYCKSLKHAEYEKLRVQHVAIQERMNKFAVKHFVGKYVKYNEYKFSQCNQLDITTHLVHVTGVKEIKYINTGKIKLVTGVRISPFCNRGVTAGKYYIRTNNNRQNEIGLGVCFKEITEKEWNRAHAKLITEDESDDIHFALIAIGNAASRYVHKYPTKKQTAAKARAEKKRIEWGKAENAYNDICYGRIDMLKAKVTEDMFNQVLSEGKTKGWTGRSCDDLFENAAPKKKPGNKKK